jgi:hypothetical protein
MRNAKNFYYPLSKKLLARGLCCISLCPVTVTHSAISAGWRYVKGHMFDVGADGPRDVGNRYVHVARGFELRCLPAQFLT